MASTPPAGHDNHHEHDHHPDHDHAPIAQQPGPVADASVRSARPNDSPAVGIVQATVFREAFTGRLPDDVLEQLQPEGFARAWRASLTAPPEGVHRLMVACAGEQVVGMAALGPSQDPDAGPAWGELTVLGVHPQARREGHGSRLLNAVVDVLRGAGAEAVTAWLPSYDEATRSFLAASGFTPDGAYRDRVVSPDGQTLREVRLSATLLEDDEVPAE